MRTHIRLLFSLAAVAALFASFAGSGATARGSDVVLEGKLVTFHSDDFAHGRSSVQSRLETAQGTFDLQLADDADSLPRADRVTVHGVRSGNAVAVAAGGVSAASGSTVVQATTGTKRLLVVLAYFANQSTPSSPTQASVNGVIFTNSNSVANYYSTVSWGKLTLTGAVTPWVQIPSTDEATSCNWSTWGSQANTAAQGAGYNLSNYDYVQYVLAPGATSCGWAGLAYLPGSQSWVRGEWADLRVSGHELGHNFGTHHSNSYSCTQSGTRVALSVPASCTSSEYGDPFSIMGSGSNREHTNYSRGNFGWLTASNTQDVTTSGSYTLQPAEPNDPTGVQALRVSRGNGTYLLLEYRQNDGTPYDNFSAGDPAVNGVTVRVTPTYSSTAQSQLVDTTPGTSSFSDSPLALNQSVYDPVSNATVTTTAVAANATVQLTFGPDSTPPSTPGGLTATATDATHVRLNWSASSDNVGVTGYRVYRVGTGLVATAGTTTYTDAGLTPDTTYSYYVTAVDGAGNASSPSSTVGAHTPILDTQAPTTPTSVAATKRTKPTRVAVTWAASTDNVGVAGYRVYRNGSLLGTTSATTFTDSKPPRGTDSYTVVAFDAAGNASTASSPPATVTV